MQEEFLQLEPALELFIKSLVAVLIIQHQWVPNHREVSADLVELPSLDFRLGERHRPDLLQDSVRCRSCDLALAGPWRQWNLDGAFSLLRCTDQYRNVALFPPTKIVRKYRVQGSSALGKHDDARCFEVQAVHRPQTRVLLFEKIEQRQLAYRTLAPDNKLICQLGHREQVLILKQNAINRDAHGSTVRLLQKEVRLVVIGRIKTLLLCFLSLGFTIVFCIVFI